MRNNDKIIAVSGLLAVSLLLGVFSVFTNGNKIHNVNAFDFSADENSTTLTPSQLIEKMSGEPVSQEEASYVNTFGDYALTYQNNVNDPVYEAVEYKNTLKITAEENKFIDKNSRNLSWVPASATYKNTNFSFSKVDGKYVTNITNYDGVDNNVNINYTLALSIKKNDANNLIRLAYNFGKESYEKLENNRELQGNYETAMQNYEDYLKAVAQYAEDKKAYDEYLIEKANYDIKYQNYQNYLANLEQYQKDLEKYNKYVSDLKEYNDAVAAYNKYLSDLEYYNANYEANKEIYDAYLESKNKIDYRLKAMNIIYEEMTDLNRTIYSAVMGNSVTSVLSHKSDIVAVGGVPAEAVDRAGAATNELRIVFEDYLLLDLDADKYNYYKLNWSHIRDNVNELARTLTLFLENDTVYNLLVAKGDDYLRKYYILVAQLIYLANAINISPVFNYEGFDPVTGTGSTSRPKSKYLDENFGIRVAQKATKTYKEILEEVEFLDTSLNYARPGPETYNQELIDLMTEPEAVPAPGSKPEVVKEPVAPKEVANPGEAPKEVANPGDYPSEVKMPTEPEYLAISDLEQVMGVAFEENKLPMRNLYGANVTVRVNDTKEINCTDKLKHLVKFYDTDGNYISEQVFTNGVVFAGTIPNKDFDKRYSSYSFVWEDATNNVVDLSTLNKSCDLYAKLVPGELREYTVSWNVNGDITSAKYKYQETPIPPENPAKVDSNGCYYEFKGWNNIVAPVENDITYVAIFAEHHYIYVTVDVEGVQQNFVYKEGESIGGYDIPTKAETSTEYFEFSEWNITKTDDYHFTYKAVFVTKQFIFITWVVDGVTMCENQKYRQNEEIKYPYATPTKAGDASFLSYILDYWTTSDGVRVDLGALTESATLYAHFTGYNSEIYTIYFLVDEEIVFSSVYGAGEIPIAPTVTKPDDETYFYTFVGWDKTIAPASENTSYNAVFEAHRLIKVTVVVNDVSETKILHDIAELILPENPTKTGNNGVSYRFSRWDTQEIDEYTFVKTAIFDTYIRITFVVEGAYSEIDFKLGDPISYDNPTKAGDETYRYEFAGWVNSENVVVNLENIVEPTTLYAKFNQIFVEYTVTWVIDGESIIQKYHYGDTLDVPANPSKPSDEVYYYEFSNWDKALPQNVTENATYTAVFNAKKFVKVTVDILGEKSTYTFRQDDEIEFDDPEVENDDYHDYEFIGWDISSNDGGITVLYTAKFNITNYYYVTWRANGEILDKEKYVEGSKVSFKKEFPVFETETKYYEFQGWSVDLNTFVLKIDTTINAKMTLKNKVKITWMTNEDTIVQYYIPGQEIIAPEAKSVYADELNYYVADGWEDYDLVATEDMTIFASYIECALVLDAKGRPLEVKFSENTYEIEYDSDSITNLNLSGLFSYIEHGGELKGIRIVCRSIDVRVDHNQMILITNNGGAIFNFEILVDKFGAYTFALNILDSNKKSIELFDITYDLILEGEFDDNGSYLYLGEDKLLGTFTNNTAELASLICGESYKIITTYNITFDVGTNYTIELDKNNAQMGEIVSVNVTLEPGWNLLNIYLNCNGQTSVIENGKFLMPKGHTNITVELEHILYTVEFYVGNACVFIFQGHYGDIVVDPTLRDPSICEIPNDENYRYVFIGWDKEVTTITGDTVYTAVFEKIELADHSITQSVSIFYTLLIVGGASLVIGGGLAAFFIIRKRRLKK